MLKFTQEYIDAIKKADVIQSTENYFAGGEDIGLETHVWYNSFGSPIDFGQSLHIKFVAMVSEIKQHILTMNKVEKMDYLDDVIQTITQLNYIVYTQNGQSVLFYRHKLLTGSDISSDEFFKSHVGDHEVQGFLKVCHESLINSLEYLKQFLSRIEKDNITHLPFKTPLENQPDKLLIALSHSQLGFFCRILKESGIIKDATVAQIAANIQKYIRTEKQPFINQETFEKKFYESESYSFWLEKFDEFKEIAKNLAFK